MSVIYDPDRAAILFFLLQSGNTRKVEIYDIKYASILSHAFRHKN